MEDMTFVNLDKQIRKTNLIIESHKNFGKGPEEDIMDLILENQLVIMKAIDKIDDKIRYLGESR